MNACQGKQRLTEQGKITLQSLLNVNRAWTKTGCATASSCNCFTCPVCVPHREIRILALMSADCFSHWNCYYPFITTLHTCFALDFAHKGKDQLVCFLHLSLFHMDSISKSVTRCLGEKNSYKPRSGVFIYQNTVCVMSGRALEQEL